MDLSRHDTPTRCWFSSLGQCIVFVWCVQRVSWYVNYSHRFSHAFSPYRWFIQYFTVIIFLYCGGAYQRAVPQVPLLLTKFSLYALKGGIKPHTFHFSSSSCEHRTEFFGQRRLYNVVYRRLWNASELGSPKSYAVQKKRIVLYCKGAAWLFSCS